MPANLSSLSPEVIINILGSLSTEKDLQSAIVSSKYFFEVFKTRRRSILLGALRSAIPGEIEDDFTLAWRAQFIWSLVPELNDTIPKAERNKRFQAATDRLRRETDRILDISQSSNGSIFQELKWGHVDLEQVWGFTGKLDYFIQSFTVNALSALYQLSDTTETPAEPASTWSTLSIAETTRVKRAFFRFEVLSCLSQVSQMNYRGITRHDKMALAEPARTYMKSLQPWELEELACVAQFYSTLVEEACEKLEHDLVKTVKEREKTYVSPSEDEKDDSHGEISDLEAWLRRYRLRWYDVLYKETSREAQIDYVISRGVSAVWRLMRTSLPTVRRMIVLSHFTSRERTSVMKLLKDIFYTDEEENAHQTHPDASPGWLWAREPMHSWYANAPANYLLRAQGYVFWDERRLENIKQFQAPREPRKAPKTWYVIWDPTAVPSDGIRRSPWAPQGGVGPEEFPRGHVKHSDLRYVEKELEDITLHRDVMQQVAREIYGVFRPGRESLYSNGEYYYSDDGYLSTSEEGGELDPDGEEWSPAKRPRYELRWRD